MWISDLSPYQFIILILQAQKVRNNGFTIPLNKVPTQELESSKSYIHLINNNDNNLPFLFCGTKFVTPDDRVLY